MDVTRINSDFSRRVVVDTARAQWLASPAADVERKPLDRIGGEIARATTIVRYAPGSSFPLHNHVLGEEFLVLEGVFSDAAGDYSAGTYVRNPPGSAHAPGTRDGCLLFVKLRQMRETETGRVVIDTARAPWLPGTAGGHAVQKLHSPESAAERVLLERLERGSRLPVATLTGGEEILVLDGILEDELGSYPPRTWIRNPAGHHRALRSGIGAVYWSKRGHLPPPA